MKIHFYNKTSINVKEKVLLEIKYKNYCGHEWFYLTKDGLCDVIINKETMNRILNHKIFPLECAIPTSPGKVVSWSRPIYSWKDRNDFRKLISELENKGIVEKSNSLWLNPVRLTRKKSGELRFCLDFRKVNDLVELDEFLIPNIQEVVRSLRNQKVFSVVDLSDGYFQVLLKKEDRIKTAFLDADNRLLQFTRMIQGYKNSPALFQRGMQLVLDGLIGFICFVYLDDILVFGDSKENHDENLKIVMNRLSEYGLNINMEKSVFEQKSVDFLGYNIQENIISPKLKRTQGILDYPAPSTKKQLRGFLGMINYDRLFIPHLSEMARPLYNAAAGKEKKLIWTAECQESFLKLKEQWNKQVELIMPNFNENFTLETDASDIGLGAVLRQGGKPVGYISRVLRGAEKNYSITEREVLSAIWAMDKFQYYLLGRKFVLITDHKAIEEIRRKSNFGTKRIQRWLDRLTMYDYEIKYIPGKELVQADSLSRSCSEINDKEEKEINSNILKFHKDFGHRKAIKEEFYKKYGIKISELQLKNVLKNCEECARKDRAHYKSAKYVEVFKPGEIFAIDLMDFNKEYKIILGIDYFSRKLLGRILSNKSSNGIVEFLDSVFNEFQFTMLKCDNGKEFENKKVAEWCSKRDVKLSFVTPHYHQENGRIERAIRTIRDALRRTKGLLKVKLPKIIRAYNNSVHRGIGITPNEAILEMNWKRVRDHGAKYKKEFKSSDVPKFVVGDIVLIKNENKLNKMDDEFKKKAKILDVLPHNRYVVKPAFSRELLRHGSQLRVWPGDVGYYMEKNQ